MVAFHANSTPTSLIEAVRARRIALKMTLRQLSKVIGRNMWAISEWENGHVVPRRSTRERLIRWLGYDPDAVEKNRRNDSHEASYTLYSGLEKKKGEPPE